jgi:hypothetical protein
MVRIRTIQIRLTRQQYDRIKNDCGMKGFGTLSSYLRYLALHQDESLSNRIREIHTLLFGGSAKKNYRKRYDENIELFASN